MSSPARTSLRSRQRGAAAVFAAVAMIGMLIAAAFAIDLAQLYVAKRQLQNMANLAALDVARAAGGCLAPDQDRQAMANSSALATLSRMGGQSTWLQGGGAVLGEVVLDAGNVRYFQPTLVEQSGQAYAFEVALQRPLPQMLMPLPNSSNDGAVMQAKASSTMAPAAAFAVGSALLSVDTADVPVLNALFSSLLGSPLSLDLLHYQGLVGSSVELLDVADEVVGGTLRQLLTESTNAPGLLSAVANVLFDAGENVAAEAIDSIAAIVPDENIILGDAIGAPSASEFVGGVGSLSIGALDLVRSLAFQLGEPVLSITPDITIPGLVETEIEVVLGQPPQSGAGPALQDELFNYTTYAQTSQGQANVSLGLPLLGDMLNLDIAVGIADARAELLEIRCAGASRKQHEVDIGVATSALTLAVNNGLDNPLLELNGELLREVPGLGPALGAVSFLLNALLGVEVDLAVCLNTSQPITVAPSDAAFLEFTGPFGPDYLAENTLPAGGGNVGGSLGGALSDVVNSTQLEVCRLEADVAGLPLGGLLAPLLTPALSLLTDYVLGLVVDSLNPLLSGPVDDLLLDPLLTTLGIDLAGAEVVVRDVYMPPPALIATH